MSYTKEIVCLANSRKSGEHCVAGKEIEREKFKLWIRPVNSPGGEALSDNDVCCDDGLPPELLDIVRVSFKRQVRRAHQSENYSIDPKKGWERIGKLKFSRISELVDPVKALWINGFHSTYGENDKIPEDKAAKLKRSLALIKPSKLLFHREYEFGAHKWKTRAEFTYRGVKYCLVVTDPTIEAMYKHKDAGDYPVKSKDVYLTVSLGEAYNGYCYKLVAGVILSPKKRTARIP